MIPPYIMQSLGQSRQQGAGSGQNWCAYIETLCLRAEPYPLSTTRTPNFTISKDSDMTAREGQFPSKIVRRFTSELEPDSDLAIQTKQYPEDVDGERDALERLRMERKYHAQNGPPGRFVRRQLLT
jgi:hypothetical protein